MSDSNLTRLAELQEQEAASEAPVGRDPEKILHDLDELGSEPDLAQVESLTEELARALTKAKPLTVTVNRENYIRLLTGKLNAPARFFDAALADAGATSAGIPYPEQGRALTFETPPPWPQAVDGNELLGELKAAFRRFVVLGDAALTVLALWVVHTYAFDVAWITPRLAITSPEKRCGKTLVLTLLHRLVAKPLTTANASSAAIFRCVEKFRPTLLIDEADTFLHRQDELRGILNSGHQRDGCVLRTAGDDYEPTAFSTFAPVAIAMIGSLPDTLADRSIAVRMARKKTGDAVERFRCDRLAALADLRMRAARWATDSRDLLRTADPEVPQLLNDRAGDNWRPLLAIADAVGGEWPAWARYAAMAGTTQEGGNSSARVLLLEDLRSVFARLGVDRLHSKEILSALTEMEDRPWPEWKEGKPLSARQMAKLLAPFGIKPKLLRIAESTARGYELAAFKDAFDRYVTPNPTRYKRYKPVKSGGYDNPDSVTGETPVTDVPEGLEPDLVRVVTDVTDREGGTGDSPRESPRPAEACRIPADVHRLDIPDHERCEVARLLTDPEQIDPAAHRSRKLTDEKAMRVERVHLLAYLAQFTRPAVERRVLSSEGEDTALDLWIVWRQRRKAKVRSERRPWFSEVNALRTLLDGDHTPEEVLQALLAAGTASWQGFDWEWAQRNASSSNPFRRPVTGAAGYLPETDDGIDV